jgi:hypothetical protein
MNKFWLAVLVVALAPALSFAQPQKPGQKPPPLNAQQLLAVKQQFDKIDKDKDGFIDLTEAAKFFRGANAKPLDPGVKKNENPFDGAKPEEKPVEKPAEKPMAKPPAKPVRPPQDQLFFEACDENGDDKVSFDEYKDHMAKAMDEQAKAMADYQKQMQDFQQKMRQANQQQQQQMQQQYQRMQQQYRQMQQNRNGGNYDPRWMRGRT